MSYASSQTSPDIQRGTEDEDVQTAMPEYGFTTSPTDLAARKLAKVKQTRNKPTLSCVECVERKTKCDRTRPTCVACTRRRSQCHYTSRPGQPSPKRLTGLTRDRVQNTTGDTATPSPISPSSTTQPNLTLSTHNAHRLGHAQVKHAWTPSPTSLTDPSLSTQTPSNIFGIGQQFPFSNYWTCAGGIAEVVGVLPSKDQADILVARYFEVMDPVYPFVHRRSFYKTYTRFWSSPLSEKQRVDADMLALHYTIYALGTQFMSFTSYDATTSSAEFYASASNQALRVYSYLNRASIYSLSAMVLLTYFLMNNNHASDAYAWAGALLRQAYALQLHRDPDIITPKASQSERQARRKLWQAIFLQDTFLTSLLRLPPTATHSDVHPETLIDEATLIADGTDLDMNPSSRVENLMSISVIAPPQDTAPSPAPPAHYSIDPMVDRNDVEYIKSMWKLAKFMQENVASPLSLQRPLVHSAAHKHSLVTTLHALYQTLPARLSTRDDRSVNELVTQDARTARQNLSLNSNYFHCLMLLHGSENISAGVECSVHETLHAAHEAAAVFIRLWRLFEAEAEVWWVFQHRAFEEALTIARLLATLTESSMSVADYQTLSGYKAAVVRVMEIMGGSKRGSLEMQRTRRDVLRRALDRISLL